MYFAACPVGYMEVTSHTTRACLRFVNSTVNYTTAASDCQQQGGDLIKINTISMGLIFLDFLFSKYKLMLFKSICHQFYKYHNMSMISNPVHKKAAC